MGVVQDFISTVKKNVGIGNKDILAEKVKNQFGLEKKGAIYYCDSFAVRFCSTKNHTDSVSNTVMSIKHIRGFDGIPLFVCVVGPDNNYLRLANATFIKQVSHSSKKLREDNIVGNINYSDIMKDYNGEINTGDNYEELFKMHSQLGFDGNISRIVSNTNSICPTKGKFVPTLEQRNNILAAPERTIKFFKSDAYIELKRDLDEKTEEATSDIQLVVQNFGHDVKQRGNLVEYFIRSKDEKNKEKIREKIKKQEVIENVVVENGLGDYSVKKDGYMIETDIKSKVTSLSSAPKGYNIDKLLEFLSKPSSIYLIYIVAINEEEKPVTELSSIFQKQILEKTKIQHHWAGRNSRGVAQFDGNSLEYFMNDSEQMIEIEEAKKFLIKILDDNCQDE